MLEKKLEEIREALWNIHFVCYQNKVENRFQKQTDME